MRRLASGTKLALAREPKQDRSRASFERVLDAATELLAEKGYSEFTLQDLSRRSKVSIGSIYCRVDGKDDLIRLVQVRVLDRLDVDQATFINRLRRQELPLRELVLETVTQFGNFLRKNASILRAFMELGARDAGAGEIGKQHFNQALHDFKLLVLERRSEIKHADPEHAVEACFHVVYASLGRYLGLGTMDHESETGNWDQLLEDLSLMALFFLLGDPRQVRPKTASARSRPPKTS
jgi:AcrR family transcriptional regulator